MQNSDRQADARRSSEYRAASDGTSILSSARTRFGQTPPNLLLEHFLDLSDLLLNFAGVFFGVAVGF
jgi:hypothetical protein